MSKNVHNKTTPVSDLELHQKRVLVTGASGFLGRHVCDQLEKAGAIVIGLSRKPPKKSTYEYVALDMVHDNLTECINHINPNAIIHCAGNIGRSDDQDMMQANHGATQRLLEAAKKMEVLPKIILVSSAAIYGPMKEGQSDISESHEWAPVGPYGQSKAAAAKLGLEELARRKMDICIAIPFNIIGLGQAEKMVPLAFFNQLERNPEKVLAGNLAAVRDLIDVRDVAIALVSMLSSDIPAGAYNIATGKGVTMGDLLERVCEIMDALPTIEVTSSGAELVSRSIGNISALQRHCSWTPQFSLTETLDYMDIK